MKIRLTISDQLQMTALEKTHNKLSSYPRSFINWTQVTSFIVSAFCFPYFMCSDDFRIFIIECISLFVSSLAKEYSDDHKILKKTQNYKLIEFAKNIEMYSSN